MDRRPFPGWKEGESILGIRRKLTVTVAALLLGGLMGQKGDAVEPTIDQLEVISALIERGEIEALVIFLIDNPGLTEGENDVAELLRSFMEEAQQLSDMLAFDPPLRTALSEGLWQAEGSSLY
jgi:hypothetical protein